MDTLQHDFCKSSQVIAAPDVLQYSVKVKSASLRVCSFASLATIMLCVSPLIRPQSCKDTTHTQASAFTLLDTCRDQSRQLHLQTAAGAPPSAAAVHACVHRLCNPYLPSKVLCFFYPAAGDALAVSLVIKCNRDIVTWAVASGSAMTCMQGNMSCVCCGFSNCLQESQSGHTAR